MELKSYQKRLYAEIDLDAVKHNYFAVKASCPEKAVICVIKANAYGHGAVELGQLYESLGAEMLAVSNIEEGMELRRAGISLPVLNLGYAPVECADILAKENIEQCLPSLEYAKVLSAAATDAGVTVRVHLKIDTGMGRIGFLCRSGEENELCDMLTAARLDSLSVVGAFTHLAVADAGAVGEEYTKEQAKMFNFAIEYLKKNGVEPGLLHLSNSAAIFDYPDLAINAIRPGISLYGEAASSDMINEPSLKPTITMRSTVMSVKTVLKGESVGYGRAFVADKDMRVATVCVGYADGLPRAASLGKGIFTVNGTPCPVLGKICMDQTMIDVTDLKDVAVGTQVIIFGGDAAMTLRGLADAVGTIPYEILTGISRRVPRVYLEGGKIVKITDYVIGDQK